MPSEYDDIQSPEDLKELRTLLQQATKMARGLAHSNKLPVPIRKVAYHIELEAEETLAFIQTTPLSEIKRERRDFEEKPGVKYHRKRKGETSKGIIEFVELLKKEPKYSSAEFKCISDFDKCKAHRGEKSALCRLALFICIGKRIIPFVRHR
jgi:hypothetical protein